LIDDSYLTTGGKKKPLKAPKKEGKELDDVSKLILDNWTGLLRN